YKYINDISVGPLSVHSGILLEIFLESQIPNILRSTFLPTDNNIVTKYSGLNQFDQDFHKEILFVRGTCFLWLLPIVTWFLLFFVNLQGILAFLNGFFEHPSIFEEL